MRYIALLLSYVGIVKVNGKIPSPILRLAVKETRNRGWWLPAGGVERGETFMEAAHRETKEVWWVNIEIVGSRDRYRAERSPSSRACFVLWKRTDESSLLCYSH